MLDLQRYREGSLRSEVHFTRGFLWAHFAAGALAVLLMLFHEVFFWAAVSGLWYLLCALIIVGVLDGSPFCRWLLSLSFFGFSVGGIYFLGYVLPELKPEQAPLIPHGVMPVWLGGFNVIYGAGGVLFLVNRRIRKACDLGFKLV